MNSTPAWLMSVAEDLDRLRQGRHHDPHGVLGQHRYGTTQSCLVHWPAVRSVSAEGVGPLLRLPGSDFFYASATNAGWPRHPELLAVDASGTEHRRIDAFSFAPTLEPGALGAFSAGRDASAWRHLGACCVRTDGIDGVRFSTWAPNAERVSVVGPFCDWDGRWFPMRVLGSSGVWELFIPGLAAGALYKFEIRHRGTGAVHLKSDPYGHAAELRPDTASIVSASRHAWGDAAWMRARARRNWLREPMAIYEVHAGSWERHADGAFWNWRELAERLIPYVQRHGFTHIELLPVTEHPLDDSWGYQCTGYFAPTSRHGTPDDLRWFTDQCHQAGIGVLLDWVPGHFPRDAHGLARFDGGPLYEYEDPRKAEHRNWGTLIFNYERHEVRSFLLSSACYWLEEFHFDGLRVDAVASMLYLDFSRTNDFVPNEHGGRHNLEAIDFLKQLNTVTHRRYPGTVVIAEESAHWPGVTRPVDDGGLGFSMKWNMGWMHDTLDYFSEDPLHRRHHHRRLTFAMMYAYAENYVLPLSHDEVVHLKRSLLGRMPGDPWQQFANLRLLYSWMWTFPGKKLLFMGGEFGHPWEWSSSVALPWWLTEQPAHQGVQRTVADLNRLYTSLPALHRYEFEPQGFAWLDCDNAALSVLSYLRSADGEHAVVALNFTPVPRSDYRVGVPQGGAWQEIFNSDSSLYGGSNLGNGLGLQALDVPHGAHPYTLSLTLPPLAAVILRPVLAAAALRPS